MRYFNITFNCHTKRKQHIVSDILLCNKNLRRSYEVL